MANINSLTSSNSYGNNYNLYGNRNVLTGLASGMDTEAMIQNSISGYLMKITSLQQSQTKIQWKQDAYRNIIDQMNSILQKYTSYTSKTNLSSNAFFTTAMRTQTLGANASAISATGTAKSDIKINSVTQLATSARYTVDASKLDVKAASEAVGTGINWGATKEVGQVNGTLTLKYGNQTIELDFDENDNDITTSGKLKDAIEKKLSQITIKGKDGSNVKANSLISVKTNGDTFSFEVRKGSSDYDGSSVYINSFSGNVGTMLGATRPVSSEMAEKVKNTSFKVPDLNALVETQNTAEYLSGKSVEVTLDGVTKTVKIGDLTSIARPDTSEIDKKLKDLFDELKNPNEDGTYANGRTKEDIEKDIEDAQAEKAEKLVDYSKKMTEELQKDLQSSIDKAFGEGRVTVGVSGGGLRFDVTENSGSTLRVASSAGEMLGIGKGGVSNYFNTSSTLKDLVGEEWLNKEARIEVTGNIRQVGSGDEAKYYDINGNRVVAEVDENDVTHWYRADENGRFLYNLEINGKSVGQFTDDTALETVITAINSDAEAGVKVSYSNLTGQFVFTANETGFGSKISFDSALAKKLFTKEENGEAVGKFEAGQDAVVNATVNGKSLTLTRSSNVIEMDGLTVTLNSTFNVDKDGKEIEGEAITFKSFSDSDTVVDTIRSFVEDINALMQSIHDAYATMPLTKATSSSSKEGYEPLTEEDKSSMSESAITAYEEKAKTGLLFGDTDLSQLYSKLLSTIQASGADRLDMEAIGLTTTYADGVTKFALDEDKLRAALESDPDKVRNVFTKTVEGGSKTNGLMESFKTTLNSYGSTSLGSPGILVSKAGTKLSAISLMNNNLQKQYDNLEKQIEQWQSRMSDKVDYYTRQFTQLEKLMSMMNNQSSMLSSLMGGY